MILYSFRRCPWAMRARLALRYAGCEVEIREVAMKNKPAELLALSPKGTVPVLDTGAGVLEESLDIMRWALAQNDPQDWRLQADPAAAQLAEALITRNDSTFKAQVNLYKYAERYPAHSREYYRQQAE
ncbi:MAG: glutathione S-transferase N-terminal domain-containing protein, partial [Pseudomonas sp.]